MIEKNYLKLASDITFDAFSVYTFTWGVLFIMELVKPRIVSNYISLTHGAILILILGIAFLILRPEDVLIEPEPKELGVKDYVAVSAIILADVFFILRYVETSLYSQLLFIFVTTASILVVFSFIQKREL